MRFLADENFPRSAVDELVRAGHHIAWVRAEASGLSDGDILAWTAREQRILLTFDKDFGDLARQAGLPPGCGIILFRMSMPAPLEIGARLSAVITSRQDWAGHFSVVEPGRVRMRRLAK